MADRSSLQLAHQAGTYDSEFEYDSEAEKKRRKYEDLAKKEKHKRPKKGHKRELEDEYNKEEGRIMRHRLISLNALDRHRELVNNYLMYYGGTKSDFKRDTSRDRTDMDVIRENHKFLWSEEDNPDETWAKRLAKKYYDKLFKEYCISDLSRYKEKKVAMRWRIEKEVQEGKGQFICGNKKCNEHEGLKSWEVNFAYMEDGEKRNALVKLRLCPDCSYKLNYHHRKREIKPKKGRHREEESRDKSSKKPREDRTDIQDTEDRQASEPASSEKDTDKEENPSEEGNIWSGPAKITEEKSREEEFDEYFEDMFL